MARFKAARDKVDQFADTHPYMDRLSKIIEIGIIAGLGLEEAYAWAVAMDRVCGPKVRKVQRGH